MPIPCEDPRTGLMGNSTGLESLETCAPCPAGVFCRGGGVVGPCAAGCTSTLSCLLTL